MKRKKASFVFLNDTFDAAIWGAELALGDEPEPVYTVEPTGAIGDDPNLTNKKSPGNPTKSYRTLNPIQVIGEITAWQGHSPEQLKNMKDARNLALRQLKIEIGIKKNPTQLLFRRIACTGKEFISSVSILIYSTFLVHLIVQPIALVDSKATFFPSMTSLIAAST